MNCTRILVVTSASITVPSDSALARMATTPITSSETCGKAFVGWSRAKARKNVPSSAAAYGIRE